MIVMYKSHSRHRDNSVLQKWSQVLALDSTGWPYIRTSLYCHRGRRYNKNQEISNKFNSNSTPDEYKCHKPEHIIILEYRPIHIPTTTRNLPKHSWLRIHKVFLILELVLAIIVITLASSFGMCSESFVVSGSYFREYDFCLWIISQTKEAKQNNFGL